MTTAIEGLAASLLIGDRRALARGITLVEDRDISAAELLRLTFPSSGRAVTVGVTGPPGVGKSTLIDRLVQVERQHDRSIAVLAVDPSSAATSGALLGDRLRMTQHFLDPKVFIRSMASRGASGGLATAASQAAMLMDASGMDTVILETVGVGQIEIDVAKNADSIVLVVMPGAGDSIQALKSGIMEIPDIVVVNRQDAPGAKATVRHVRESLSLRRGHEWRPPILTTDALDGRGVDQVSAALESHQSF